MEKARLINKNNGIVAPTANMKMTLQVTIVFVNKSIRYFFLQFRYFHILHEHDE